MVNNDDGGRHEVLIKGNRKICRKRLKEELKELKDDGVEIFDYDEDSIDGIGSNGEFHYFIE
jgi:hypothetical protein